MEELKLPFEDGLSWIRTNCKDAHLQLHSRTEAGDRYEVKGHTDAKRSDPCVLVLLTDRS